MSSRLALVASSLIWGCAWPAVTLESPAGDVTGSSEAALEPLSPEAQARAAEWRKQVLYLVMPDRFFNGDTSNDRSGIAECFRPQDPFGYHGGDLEGLRQKAGYLQNLGVTALWTTPVYRQVAEPSGHCGYHGYWADFTVPDDFALEPKLGSPSQFDGLLSELHGRDMRLILDMVVNHAGDLSRIAKQRPQWFHPEQGCGALGPAQIYCPLDHHPDFAHEQGEVADYLDAQGAGWVQRFAIDGIRMDTAKHVEPWYFAQRWVPAVRAQRSSLFLVGEVFDDNVSAAVPYLGAGFDSAFQFGLRSAFVASLARNGSVDSIADAILRTRETVGTARMLMMTNLLDNHDVPRFTTLPGFGVSEDEIRKRYHLALAALFTVPGIPQLYYGNELGLYGGGDPDNRRDMPGWAYDRAGRTTNHPGESVPGAEGTFEWTRKLISLRRSILALHSGEYTELWRQHGGLRPNVLAFFRHTGGSRAIVVLNNNATQPAKLSIPLCDNPALNASSCGGEGLVWEDQLGNAPALVSSHGKVSVSLPARTAALYVPRTPSNATAVTFEVRARTQWGETLEVGGDIAELGGGEAEGSLRLEAKDCLGNECTWHGTLRYVPHGQSFTYRVLRRGANAVVSELLPAGSVQVGTAPALTVQR